MLNSRISINELAERVSVSRTNAYARVARLRADCVIEGFTVRLDPRKIGLPVAALVAVDLEQPAWRQVREKIASFPEIEYYAYTAGQFDMFLLVRAPDNETLRDFILEKLNALDGVRSTTTFVILSDVAPSPARPLSSARAQSVTTLPVDR